MPIRPELISLFLKATGFYASGTMKSRKTSKEYWNELHGPYVIRRMNPHPCPLPPGEGGERRGMVRMNHRTRLKRGLDRIEIELVPFVFPCPPHEGEDRGGGGAANPKSTIQNLKS